MKKKIVSALGGILLAMTVLTPTFAWAQARPTSTAPASGGFCSAFSGRVSSMRERLSDMLNKLGERKTDRKDNLERRWNDYLNDLKGRHDRQDRELSLSVDRLNERATTDIQRAAVTAFRSAMQAALSARRTAVAAALKAFHDGVAAALEAKKSGLANALEGAADEITVAGEKAKADCAKAGITSLEIKTIRTAFMSAVQSARSSFNSARKQDDLSAQMKQLTATKNAALKKAHEDFRAAATASRDALKATLGKTSTSTPSAPPAGTSTP